MRAYLISFIIFTTVFGKNTGKCKYEPDREQAITCVCKGKVNGGYNIKGPFCNYAHGEKEADYCGVKSAKDAETHCKKVCPRPSVEEVKIFEKKKCASK